MANRRMIYQDLFEDDYFGMADPLLRLMWIGLITAVADDQGRMLDNSSLIKSKVFIYDREITEQMIDSWLNTLHKDNKIVRYEAGGHRLIQIVKWWDYQTPAWASSSRYEPPTGWTDRVRCHISGSKQGGRVETINWENKGGFTKDTKDNTTDGATEVLHNKLHNELPKPINDVNDDVNVNGDINVNGDGDGKTVTTVSETQNSNSEVAEVFKAYESEIGILTSFVREEVLDAIERYPRDWIIEAIKEAARNNARKWSYAEAILKSWKVNGYKTDVRFRTQSGKSKQGGSKSYLSPELQKMMDDEKEKRKKLYGGVNGK